MDTKLSTRQMPIYNHFKKNRKDGQPENVLELVKCAVQNQPLPFKYEGSDISEFALDAFLARQKVTGVINSQYITPAETAVQIAKLTDSFTPSDNKILNACSGIGQITKELIKTGLEIIGFDVDAELAEVCSYIYPKAKFFHLDYRDYTEQHGKWDLIVSNPPQEQKDLQTFFQWLTKALSANGKAIVLISKARLEKPGASLSKELKKFTVAYQEDLKEQNKQTTNQLQLVVFGLKNAENITPEEKPENVAVVEVKAEIQKANEKIEYVPLSQIVPRVKNCRRKFDEAKIKELAEGIKHFGLISPAILRPIPEDKFEIVCGERRYRATMLIKENVLKSIIRDLTDEEANDLSFIENMAREDLTPIEEGLYYMDYIETNKYSVEQLSKKFRISEGTIRDRIKLLSLIPEFQDFIENDKTFKIGFGIELAKYPQGIQKEVYKTHFSEHSQSKWGNLSVNEFTKALEANYSTQLSKYSFDKEECKKCFSNLGTHALFTSPENGRCTNMECLSKKKTAYTIAVCQAIVEDPKKKLDICIKPFERLSDEVEEALAKDGIFVETTNLTEFPVMPEEPKEEDFKIREEYVRAYDNYQLDVKAYQNEMEDINAKIAAGTHRKVLHIGEFNPRACYAPVKVDTEALSPMEKLELEKRDLQSKHTSNIIRDIAKFLKDQDIPKSTAALSNHENRYMFFVMLSMFSEEDLKKHFNINSKNGDIHEQIWNICLNISPDLGNSAIRYFLRDNLVKTGGECRKSMILHNFALMLFPDEVNDIQGKHTLEFSKKMENITNKINRLKESVVEE